MGAIQKKIRYLRECYAADSSGIELQNIFARSVEHRMFIEGANKLSFEGKHQIPLDLKLGKEAHDAALIYEREKELVFGATFLVGKQDRSIEKYASPVIIFPGKIEIISDFPFLLFDTTNFRINYGLIKRVIPDDEKSSLLHEHLFEAVMGGMFKPEGVAAIVDAFNRFGMGIDASQMIFFPKVVPTSELRKNSGNEGLKLLPAGCVALVKRSIERRGILEELSVMSESNEFSRPVNELLGIAAPTRGELLGYGEIETKLERIPAVLTTPQKNILYSSSKHTTTLVIGPPGTGKSYTIACLALEHMARGQSVLIASRKDHAVDVIAEKIETLSGDRSSVVRGGRKKYLSVLKARLQAILSGMRSKKNADSLKEQGEDQAISLTRKINLIEQKLSSDEQLFEKYTDQEKKFVFIQEELSKGGIQLVNRFKFLIIRWLVSARKNSFVDLIKSVERWIEDRNEAVVKRIAVKKDARVNSILASDRKTLMAFLKSLRARTGSKQRDILSNLDIRVILKTFPVWMSKNSDIHDNLPLIAELFDLAIIDESTQCDIASCLPVLQRAKRVAIVGDPKQLRHVSFLARSKQAILAMKAGLDASVADYLDYRSKSILDLADETITSQERVQFLDEHYRSRPDIIQFSNDRFYNGSIRIMTQNPELVDLRNIKLIRCEGIREKNGVNKIEADRMLAAIRESVELQKGLDFHYSQSIGLTTPFRNQAEFLSELVLQEFDLDTIKKHKILIGTPHSFQGEERDLMFISIALDNNSSATAFRYLNQPDVFNVMITRARVEQFVFLSVEENKVKNDSLLGAYLSYVKKNVVETETNQLAKLQISAIEVYNSLVEAGFKVWPSYELAGLELDFVVQTPNCIIGLDLIGFPGRFEDAFSLDRYKMFRRAGLRIFPLAFTEWEKSSDACLNAIRDF